MAPPRKRKKKSELQDLAAEKDEFVVQRKGRRRRGKDEEKKEPEQIDLSQTSQKEMKDVVVKRLKRPLVAASQQEGVATSGHSIADGKESGQVMVIGQGDTGQLGLGEDVMEKGTPAPVGGALEGHRVVQVVCGGMHTAALTDDSKVFTWGCNDEGALGREVVDGEEFSPGLVEGELEHKKVIHLSAGDSHTAALLQNGDVYCWGVFRDSSGPFGLVKAGFPTPLPTLIPSGFAIKIASGSDHLAILTRSGDILTMGCAEQGQLGRVPEIFCSRGGRRGAQFLLKPQIVRCRRIKSCQPKFLDVFCGGYHTFALSEDRAVYTWGLNNFGQLGTSDLESRYQPQRLGESWIEGGYKNLEISSGEHHTLVLNNGMVYTMGRREYGRLGFGQSDSMEPSDPTRIPDLTGVKCVAAGTACSFAVGALGEVYSWGMGTNLQLGTGEEDDMWTPTKVDGKKLEGRKVVGVSSGGQHTALLVSLPQ